MRYTSGRAPLTSQERIPVDGITLEGDLTIPEGATGIVLFAHGSGSSRFSPRNRAVAADLHAGGFATLLLDLLTAEEERSDALTGHLRFDIGLLARRLLAATRWASQAALTARLPIGYFGGSTGAAAALRAAAQIPETVEAIVSRGGRPDLAGEESLSRVRAPTLLIVGSRDEEVLRLNRSAMARIPARHKLVVIPGATHLFEEPGTLDTVARVAARWFAHYLVLQGTEARL